MTSRLTEIRNAATDVLKTKFQRVYSGRGFAPAQSQLPCVVVYVDSRRTEQETFDFPPTYRQTVRLVTLVCVQANTDADELAEEMLSVVQQAFVEHPDLGIDGLENLVPDLLNIDSDDSGEAVTVYYQQGWQAVYFEQAV
jgi:putative phage associated protein